MLSRIAQCTSTPVFHWSIADGIVRTGVDLAICVQGGGKSLAARAVMADAPESESSETPTQAATAG